jgi:hypothetical protein
MEIADGREGCVAILRSVGRINSPPRPETLLVAARSDSIKPEVE